ncbi:MAG: DUF3810 domain-containing protein [Flavisolibacter sp.]|nr:DUF3810 domain-containing protein [Flavisolibacter sp.]
MKPLLLQHHLYRYRSIILLLFIVLCIHLFSLNSAWVERYYTYSVYPVIERTLRLLFGWLPFSIGDVLYFSAGVYLIVKGVKFFVLLRKRVPFKFLLWTFFRKLIRLLLVVYILFNLLWGLNYSRQGIDHQLGLSVTRYSVSELSDLASAIQQRLNTYAAVVDSLERIHLGKNRIIFSEARATYQKAQQFYPYLTYTVPSIKPSLYSDIGHYFGFTGYYNPFTGEAQVKTSIPNFLKPFVVTHEIAHQLGYAKENEANFVAFLSSRTSGNNEVIYSAYFEMYLYAMSELKRKDSVLANQMIQHLHPQVKRDEAAYRKYLLQTRNPVEPYISLFYDQYLKWNRQPKGVRTYNEVIAWLIAYMKKNGAASI